MSQTAFGEKLGVGIGVIKNIEYANVDPKEPFLTLMCDMLNVNKNWLIHGTGEMFLERDTEDEIADFLTQLMCDDDESIRKRFVLALSKFDGDDWKTVEKFIDAFTQTEKDGE
jgi:transcriptional regulator with XRE-family HTH domain